MTHDIDHLDFPDPEHAPVHFPCVRVVEKNGALGAEIWHLINRKQGKQHDVMAELAGPHLPGSSYVEQKRQSVTWDRIVFVDESGEPLVREGSALTREGISRP
jgi:hypothetical protein